MAAPWDNGKPLRLPNVLKIELAQITTMVAQNGPWPKSEETLRWRSASGRWCSVCPGLGAYMYVCVTRTHLALGGVGAGVHLRPWQRHALLSFSSSLSLLLSSHKTGAMAHAVDRTTGQRAACSLVAPVARTGRTWPPLPFLCARVKRSARLGSQPQMIS